MLTLIGTHKSTGIRAYVDEENKTIQLEENHRTEWFYYHKNGMIRNHGYGSITGPQPFMMLFGNNIFNNYDTFLTLIKEKIYEVC